MSSGMRTAAERIVAEATAMQRQAADPDASVWVSASAGSGKTKVLVDRVLSLLLRGSAPGKILCLTFTKAAAAEMANRLSGELAGWVIADDAALRARLERLLEIGSAHVRTPATNAQPVSRPLLETQNTIQHLTTTLLHTQ